MSMTASTRKNPRILVVDVQSASLSSRKRMATYALIWIDPCNKFRTKSSYSMAGKKPIWNEKFVFSVPNEFIYSRDAPITFELYRARKHLSDRRIGTAILNLATVFGNEPKKGSIHDTAEAAEETVYDTDEEQEEELDELHYNMYEEFRHFVEEDDRWGNAFAGDDDDEPEEEEEEEEEEGNQKEIIKIENEDEKEKAKKDMKSDMKGSANLEIKKGLENRGMLSVELKVWGGSADCVGKFNFHNWGMRYEEFMGNPGEGSVHMKKPFLCFPLLIKN